MLKTVEDQVLSLVERRKVRLQFLTWHHQGRLAAFYWIGMTVSISVAPYTVVVQQVQQPYMRDFVKSFGKVHQNDIYLFPFGCVGGDFLDGGKELSLAGASLVGTMLVVAQDVVPVKVMHDITMHYVLQQFARYGRQGLTFLSLKLRLRLLFENETLEIRIH